MMSRALLLIACLSVSATLQAQTGTVVGVVTDTAGKPIRFARVQLSDTAFVDTGIAGAYSLRVPSGRFAVYVEAAGHERDSAAVDVIPSGESIAHFALVPGDPLATRWYGCGASIPTSAMKCLLPARLPSRDLWVTDAEHWVFRTRDEWEAFWGKYWNPRTSPSPPQQPAPDIDWQNEFIVVVGEGGTSGCSNGARYVNRVVLSREATEVVIGPEERGSEITCAMVIAPVDVIVVPRGPYGPVRFRDLEPVFRLPPP